MRLQQRKFMSKKNSLKINYMNNTKNKGRNISLAYDLLKSILQMGLTFIFAILLFIGIRKNANRCYND